MTDTPEVNPQDPLNPQPVATTEPPQLKKSRAGWIIGLMVVIVAAMLIVPRFVKPKSAGLAGDVSGKPAPEFELKDLNGKTVHLSDYRGKAVVLNFWATWCPPCKVEMPWFVDLQERYGSQGLVILGVALDDASKEQIAKFASDMKLNYPVLIGEDKVAQAYGGVEMLPTTFYIDRNGKVTERVFGLLDRKEIEENAVKVLESKAEGGAK